MTVAFKKLLENAIKFTDEGVVSVLLETVDRGKDRYHRIRFKDTGIGIASKDYALVFEPFRQASEVLGRHFEGSGLGLPIAKKVIGLLKGELEIESMLYKGSTFTVYLPCARKQKGISASPVIAEGKPSIPALVELLSLFDRKPNVLLVEDNEMNGVLVISMLSKICRVVHAWNGKAAIERSSEEIFDLVLMDINLGAGLNGMEVTREIKKNEAYKNIPFSAVTGYTLKEEREKILNAGLNFYLGKPFKKDELLSTIQAMLFDLLKSMGKL
ncbi:MAG: response regulator [Bacteroidetes bacterium]|nr:response regulator [Bacteroidota bacterium]